ncbi:protein-L-isoaspartate O-methyltransferase [Kineobactrum sediminis]|uniref:Protein-L-isoaspartate O-methyltransferase n=1 Tax=Kineobactrum sediminis TaxID=1905677 RepID=A0A2N5XYR6_9GAMM|nr:erythromycin esterase family protein [Kineobactrum sediminis]PLW81288.1 protein-L-isoaspartate O-methyltransferase [Kineobactrum sediminis]
MDNSVVKALQQHKQEFTGSDGLRPLLESVKDKKIVMLGEASHGTHEYYKWRAKISKILMEDYGFDFVAVEGDWPPCYELNRHVKNYDDAVADTGKVLQHFERWPSWMWANWEVYEWAQWLRQLNQGLAENKRKGFYGLDVYSLWESMDAIMDYLKDEDPDAFETAKMAMRCFEPHRDGDGQRYALSTRLVPEGCSAEVTQLLREIRSKVPTYNTDREQTFSVEQNAMVSNNAERYYRIMASGDESTWNLRDQHMMDTLSHLMAFHGSDAKGIVWAHNTHIGDASYTDMGDAGLYNIGELGREEYGRDKVALIGFGSYRGSVLAGSSWGSPVQEIDLPEARENSWEEWCHQAGTQFYIASGDLMDVPELQRRVPHRAVGVVYNPRHERYGNYVPSIIPQRYDHFIFFDETRGLHAIDIREDKAKMPDTYPYGF